MHDPAQRRKATRSGRQTGCYIYIPAEALKAAGWAEPDKLPAYRTWGTSRGVVLVRLYRET